MPRCSNERWRTCWRTRCAHLPPIDPSASSPEPRLGGWSSRLLMRDRASPWTSATTCSARSNDWGTDPTATASGWGLQWRAASWRPCTASSRSTTPPAVEPASMSHCRWRADMDPVPRVLVVDDEPQIRRALTINLRARGYDVDVAETGEE